MNGNTDLKKTLYFIAALLVLNVFSNIYIYFDIKGLRCDVSESVIAEREYIYPIIRKIGDPSKFGKDVVNPLRTDAKYNCN